MVEFVGIYIKEDDLKVYGVFEFKVDSGFDVDVALYNILKEVGVILFNDCDLEFPTNDTVRFIKSIAVLADIDTAVFIKDLKENCEEVKKDIDKKLKRILEYRTFSSFIRGN